MKSECGMVRWPLWIVYDGGDAGAISDTTGPMWEEVVGMQGKFPLGVGGGLAAAVGDTGGQKEHTLHLLRKYRHTPI